MIVTKGSFLNSVSNRLKKLRDERTFETVVKTFAINLTIRGNRKIYSVFL